MTGRVLVFCLTVSLAWGSGCRACRFSSSDLARSLDSYSECIKKHPTNPSACGGRDPSLGRCAPRLLPGRRLRGSRTAREDLRDHRPATHLLSHHAGSWVRAADPPGVGPRSVSTSALREPGLRSANT